MNWLMNIVHKYGTTILDLDIYNKTGDGHMKIIN